MYYARIPKERVAVLIGKGGEVKREIEERSGARLEIDSESGDVTIDERNIIEPVLTLKVQDVVRAIGRGFAPENAFRLFQDDVYFELIDIKDYAGKSPQNRKRLRARVIGTKGKTRKLIQELTGASVCVYGNTVALIGDVVELEVARTAVDMLLRGSEHSTVYRFLERKRRYIKASSLEMV